jgi:VCBS repeat-containing protein
LFTLKLRGHWALIKENSAAICQALGTGRSSSNLVTCSFNVEFIPEQTVHV